MVFCSALAAYAFARLHWRGRNLVFSLFLCALMIPGILTLLPNFVFIKNLGLINSFAGLILPGALFSAFDIFFLRQFMLGMSTEIEEAAVLDGAGRIRVLFRIVLPMTAVPVTTLTLLTFINTWNDYFWPLLVANNQERRAADPGPGPVQAGLSGDRPRLGRTDGGDHRGRAADAAAVHGFGGRIVNSIGFSGLRCANHSSMIADEVAAC